MLNPSHSSSFAADVHFGQLNPQSLTATRETTVNDLGSDVMVKIFGFLGDHDVRNCSRTCKEWYQQAINYRTVELTVYQDAAGSLSKIFSTFMLEKPLSDLRSIVEQNQVVTTHALGLAELNHRVENNQEAFIDFANKLPEAPKNILSTLKCSSTHDFLDNLCKISNLHLSIDNYVKINNLTEKEIKVARSVSCSLIGEILPYHPKKAYDAGMKIFGNYGFPEHFFEGQFMMNNKTDILLQIIEQKDYSFPYTATILLKVIQNYIRVDQLGQAVKVFCDFFQKITLLKDEAKSKLMHACVLANDVQNIQRIAKLFDKDINELLFDSLAKYLKKAGQPFEAHFEENYRAENLDMASKCANLLSPDFHDYGFAIRTIAFYRKKFLD